MMLYLLRTSWQSLSLQIVSTHKPNSHLFSLFSTMLPSHSSTQLSDELCSVVSSGVGSLGDLEASLGRFSVSLSSSLVTQVLDSCKNEAPTRRLLRFFLWSHRNLNHEMKDEDFNHAIRVFAEKKDFTAMDIMVKDLQKEGRPMEPRTFSVLADSLVMLGREDEALGIFKNLEKFKCPQDKVTVVAIVNALCAKGHAKRAEGVVWHHKDKILGAESCIYRSLLYGWSELKNVKETRRIIKEMKMIGITQDLYCYNTFLRCLCEQNLNSNPSGLVPESLNVFMEMRSHGVAPNSISYNILLSSLGKARRVKESLRILDLMRKSGCSPDWVSFYIVARVLYLMGRFGKGKQIVDHMIDEGLVPENKFYYDLIGILCGVERSNYALELFEKMKNSSSDGYGPVYDLLIPKLCRGGEFEKGKELWDEAMAMGVTLQCSRDVLNPTITEVFEPTRKVKEEVHLADCTTARTRVGRTMRKAKNKKKNKKNKKSKTSTSSTR